MIEWEYYYEAQIWLYSWVVKYWDEKKSDKLIVFDEVNLDDSIYSNWQFQFYVVRDWKEWYESYWYDNIFRWGSTKIIEEINIWWKKVYKVENDWKYWYIEAWKEEWLENKIIFDSVWEIKELWWKIVYEVKKDFRRWYIELWKETEWEEKVIFDIVKDIQRIKWKLIYKVMKDKK